MNDLELNKVVSKLMPMIEDGNCIVWVGSGLSKNADYPDWKETVKELCDKCEVISLSKSEEESSEKLIDKAEECKKAEINVYHNTLANLFGRQPIITRFAYQSLMKLPFKAYVTTNFDSLLSEAGEIEGNEKVYSYPRFPPELGNSHPIVYVHGHARQNNRATGKNLILARSDFDEAYNTIGIVKNFIVHIFTHYPLLFLGCSLTEPVMYEVFQKVHDIHTRIKRNYPDLSLPKRYIMLPIQKQVYSEFPDENTEQVEWREKDEINRLNKMDIEIIRYEPNDWESHGEIEYVLRKLCKYTKMPKNAFENEELP